MSFMAIAEMTEAEARSEIERIRWPDGPVCPNCGGSDRIYSLQGPRSRAGLYKCGVCLRQFTVTVGTVMERSHLPLKKWLLAFHLMCSSKKGVSALQLQRELHIGSYRTAWFLCHRIREAMKESPLRERLKGIVEADETYIGGKPRKDVQGEKAKSKPGRGTKKTPVFLAVERGGRAASRPMGRLTIAALHDAVQGVAAPSATIMTDDWSGYQGIGEKFLGGHFKVNHALGQYSLGDIHVNNAESYFALMKRGIHGIFHHISKQHLERYCEEFSFRWNHRRMEDEPRTEAAIAAAAGKRLMYRELKPAAMRGTSNEKPWVR
jgi:transposase-like protein